MYQVITIKNYLFIRLSLSNILVFIQVALPAKGELLVALFTKAELYYVIIVALSAKRELRLRNYLGYLGIQGIISLRVIKQYKAAIIQASL